MLYINIASPLLDNQQSAKLYNITFHQAVVVSRYRDPQLQVGENISFPITAI